MNRSAGDWEAGRLIFAQLMRAPLNQMGWWYARSYVLQLIMLHKMNLVNSKESAP
jgi:hypothetical protein